MAAEINAADIDTGVAIASTDFITTEIYAEIDAANIDAEMAA
jgi:hypothetical protein